MFLYLNTLEGVLGDRAKLSMSVLVPTAHTACLQFHYNIVSNGALQVSLLDLTGLEIVWVAPIEDEPTWKTIQIELKDSVQLIYFDGTVGRGGSLLESKNYIALDDIEIRDTPCEFPGEDYLPVFLLLPHFRFLVFHFGAFCRVWGKTHIICLVISVICHAIIT